MGIKVVLGTTIALWALCQGIAGADKEVPIVTTRLATVRGQYKQSYEGRKYAAFEGLPYALPPTGSRRFQAPHPITEKSRKIIQATEDPPLCAQYDYQNKASLGQEDCLYLNIYTPSITESSNLPVLVWFHEGAFQRGSGIYTKAKYLMDRDVILVTLNYRLGVFGFLSTEDAVVSGNMGLKDQNLAIKWVAENIGNFGGDPKKISLVGVSAGGTSVQYHYLSRMSAGLFRNGISFSGTALSPWGYSSEPVKAARRLAGVVGCPTEETREMVECLRKKKAEELTEATRELLKETTNQFFYYPFFMPVAEKNTEDYFIDRSPKDILRSGDVYDVPWVSGIVSEEGGSTVSGLAFNQTALSYIDEHWVPLNPYMLMYNDTFPVGQHSQVARAARDHYIGKDAPLKAGDPKTMWGLLYMKTHEAFTIVLEKSVRMQARATRSPVRAYYYSYRAAQSHSEELSNSKFDFGVCHLDDILLVLENRFIDPTKTSTDKAMLKTMLDFWYTSAVTGKPDLGVEWPAVDPNAKEFTYMHIPGPNNSTVERSDNFGDKKFWSSIGFHLDA